MKEYTILAINPGSTSTKVAVYRNRQPIAELTLRHSAEELEQFATIVDQFDFRRRIIVEAIEEAGIRIADLDAVIGRGGLIKPIPSGVYKVNETLIKDIKFHPAGQHASNLGALLAHDIAREAGADAFIADPVVVDELQDVARVSGLPQISRISIFHALNQKAIARRYAEQIGRQYEELNLIVAHLGGGISVGAHRKGQVIDVNNALDGEGPFSPERAGTLPAGQLVRMCFSGKYTQAQIQKMLCGAGGVVAHLGTNDMRLVDERAESGDRMAAMILEAMGYGIGKQIGAMAAVLKGKVDAIILTGGIAYDTYIVAHATEMVSFIAPVVVIPGENELEALADNALRVLEGRLTPKVYV